MSGDERSFEDALLDPNFLILHQSTHSIEVLEGLVHKEGASLTVQDPFMGYTPLHFASEVGVSENVEWFLENGASWSTCNHFQQTAAETALAEGYVETHDIIFNHAVQKEYCRYHRPWEPSTISNFSGVDVERRDNDKFLAEPVTYTEKHPHSKGTHDIAMVDVYGTAVMSEWERPLMEETARLLFEGMGEGKSCLNIGFGLGIIDSYFQSYKPTNHTIIEAHPECLAYMRKNGWYDKPNVRILEGRWQDFIQFPGDEPSSEDTVRELGKFDVVYFDTYEEGYRGNFEFFAHIPRLLSGPSSRFSLFHGHGRKQPFVYKVYCEVIRRHLNDLGLNVIWNSIHIDPKTIWDNWRDKPDSPRNESHDYQIPICALAPTIPKIVVPRSGWSLCGGDTASV